jgi:hypothetical protein
MAFLPCEAGEGDRAAVEGASSVSAPFVSRYATATSPVNGGGKRGSWHELANSGRDCCSEFGIELY